MSVGRPRSPWGLAPLFLAALVSACGGSGGSPSSGTPASTPVPASSSNPCTAALAATGGVAASATGRSPKSDGYGHDDRDPREFMALHLLPRDGGVSARAASSSAARSGDIAVVSDDGSIVIGANPFDLGGAALRFDPNGQGGYDVRRASGGFRPDLGRRVRLADDATSQEALAFAFPFYGAARPSVFVNSDGNLTFDQGDVETSARSLGRVLSGAPRVAPFFADLDPSAGGGIFVSAASDAFTVTWCAVPDFDDTGKVTAQASLLAGGAVEIRIDAATTLKDAVVALSPGATGAFAAVDLSAASGTVPGGSGAVGEYFAAEASLDLVSASRLFYAEFPDNYDQLLFWSDTRVVESGTFAFETTIQNAVTGIGQEVVSFAGAYGSGGRLSSLVVMDDLGKYPSDPVQRANGENSTLALVAHETGHRWGATLQFRDHEARRLRRVAGSPARALELLLRLGRLRPRGQRDRGPGRRLVPHHRHRLEVRPVRPVRDGASRRVRGAARVLRGEPLGREPGPGVAAPDGDRLHRHAPRGLDRGRGRGHGPAQPARLALPPLAPAGVGLRRGPRAHRRPRRDREAGDDPAGLRGLLLGRDRRPHERRDAPRLTGADRCVPK